MTTQRLDGRGPIGVGPVDGDEQRLEEWLKDRPIVIAQMAREWPPWFCYRSTENPRFHYRIHSYSENGTVTLVHAGDSTLPGVATFGQAPEQLIVCACGLWQDPTPAQAKATQKRMRAWARRRGGAHEGCTDPLCVVCKLNPNQGN